MKVLNIKIGVTVFFSMLLFGCQSFTYKRDLESFNMEYEKGNYSIAANNAVKSGGITQEGRSEDLLWSLQAGSAFSANGDFEKSSVILDFAEGMMKTEDSESIAKKVGESTAAILVNNNVNAYAPMIYDGVMVNTYKGLNNIFIDDNQNARIEFNRADDRQRRAAEEFKDEIYEASKKLKEDENQSDNSIEEFADLEKSKKESKESIYNEYPELSEWKVYPGFINPYTDYLHALYFMLASKDKSDFSKARQSLRRVAGMAPKNKAVRTDLMVINKLRQGVWRKGNLNKSVWVIFENGLSPEVQELLIPIPLFLVNDNVAYSQVALPKLKFKDVAYPYLDVYSEGEKLGRTELLASMDKVIQGEFKKRFPYKVAEAIASTLAKTYIQYKVQSQGGDSGAIGGIAVALYQAVTTRADIRSWTALPKEVQVLRIKKPGSGELSIRASGLAEPLSIKLPENDFIIVYIKASSPLIEPTYHVAGFDK